MRTLLLALLTLLPWKLRRPLLQYFFGYKLHPTSFIGFAWVYPRRLVMGAGTSIGHLTVVRDLELVELGECARIGRLNWISAYPLGKPPHFAHMRDRAPELVLGEHASITNRHIVDCTERVRIGRFSDVGGFRSQILTHSVELEAPRQHARPVEIGDYCLVGTACTVLGGSVMPHHSALASHSLLNSAFDESYTLYGGVPAARIKSMPQDTGYFNRTRGYII